MKWTPEEIPLLKQLYCTTNLSCEEISRILNTKLNKNRSASSIRNKARHMNLEHDGGLTPKPKVDSFEQWNVSSFVVEQMKNKHA